MKVREATSLCPELRLLPAYPTVYQQLRIQIADVAQQCSDQVEVEGGDQQLICFADLGPLRRDDAIATAQALGREVRRQTGLAASIGIASRGRFPAAIIAAQTRANHLRLLHTTAAQTLINQQPLHALEMPDWMRTQLARLGWHTVGDFAALPVGSVAERFGAVGVELHRLARGETAQPIRRRLPKPHISATYRAEEPLVERQQLARVIPLLSERLSLELGAHRQRTTTLWIRVVQEDGEVQERRRTLRHSVTAPSRLDQELGTLVQQVRITAGVVELTAIASDLQTRSDGAEQLSLWQQNSTSFRQEVVPLLKRRYGADRLWQVQLDQDATSPTQAVRFLPIDEDI